MADEFHVIIRRMRAEDAAYVAEIERNLPRPRQLIITYILLPNIIIK